MWSICFGSAGIYVDRPVVQVIKRLEKKHSWLQPSEPCEHNIW